MGLVVDVNGNQHIADFIKVTDIPYQIDIDDTVENADRIIYERYYSNEKTAIKRITIKGNTITNEWAIGRWEDRATLVYKPINEMQEEIQ